MQLLKGCDEKVEANHCEIVNLNIIIVKRLIRKEFKYNTAILKL